eukprot:scaffold120183_cov42-Phaeocystis_antarctica.AAC.1
MPASDTCFGEVVFIVFCAASFMLARLVWTILRALGNLRGQDQRKRRRQAVPGAEGGRDYQEPGVDRASPGGYTVSSPPLPKGLPGFQLQLEPS